MKSPEQFSCIDTDVEYTVEDITPTGMSPREIFTALGIFCVQNKEYIFLVAVILTTLLTADVLLHSSHVLTHSTLPQPDPGNINTIRLRQYLHPTK